MRSFNFFERTNVSSSPTQVTMSIQLLVFIRTIKSEKGLSANKQHSWKITELPTVKASEKCPVQLAITEPTLHLVQLVGTGICRISWQYRITTDKRNSRHPSADWPGKDKTNQILGSLEPWQRPDNNRTDKVYKEPSHWVFYDMYNSVKRPCLTYGCSCTMTNKTVDLTTATISYYTQVKWRHCPVLPND